MDIRAAKDNINSAIKLMDDIVNDAGQTSKPVNREFVVRCAVGARDVLNAAKSNLK